MGHYIYHQRNLEVKILQNFSGGEQQRRIFKFNFWTSKNLTYFFLKFLCSILPTSFILRTHPVPRMKFKNLRHTIKIVCLIDKNSPKIKKFNFKKIPLLTP